MCQAKTKAVKTQLVFLVVSFIVMRVFAQPVKDSLERYVRILEYRPNDLPALSKAAEYSIYLGGREEEASKKKIYFEQSLAYAEKCKMLYPHAWQTYIALAAAFGGMQQLSKDKSFKKSCAINVKLWIDQALKINPDYAASWSMLGMWHYRMTNLGTVESLFAGELKKEASLLKAYQCLEKAIQLNEHEARFYFLLAMISRKMNLKDEARSHLLKAIEQTGGMDLFFIQKCEEQLVKI